MKAFNLKHMPQWNEKDYSKIQTTKKRKHGSNPYTLSYIYFLFNIINQTPSRIQITHKTAILLNRISHFYKEEMRSIISIWKTNHFH